MFLFYNNDEPVDWVMGQIDVAEEKTVFGVQVETSGISWIRWKNGVEGLLTTGGAGLTGFGNRLIGTEGVIDVGGGGVPVRMLREGGDGWEEPDLTGLSHERDATILSILDLIHCIKTGREPELSGRKALQATELIFATYQSSRQRAKINLPLTVDDSALLTMVANGDIG